jgi:hypothetical protein
MAKNAKPKINAEAAYTRCDALPEADLNCVKDS